MKKKHEQTVIDMFSSYFLRKGSERGRTTNKLSLDGQDALLGADYIFTSNTQFALIEFKYEEEDLKAEAKKELRKLLCKELDFDQLRLQQSLECHYIGWSHILQKRKISLNQYYREICNNAIFINSSLINDIQDSVTRMSAERLVDQFIDGDVGSNFEVFKSYTDWLVSISGRGGTIEVMLDNRDSDELDILEFKNLDLLNEWLIQNTPRNDPEPSQGPGLG